MLRDKKNVEKKSRQGWAQWNHAKKVMSFGAVLFVVDFKNKLCNMCIFVSSLSVRVCVCKYPHVLYNRQNHCVVGISRVIFCLFLLKILCLQCHLIDTIMHTHSSLLSLSIDWMTAGLNYKMCTEISYLMYKRVCYCMYKEYRILNLRLRTHQVKLDALQSHRIVFTCYEWGERDTFGTYIR